MRGGGKGYLSGVKGLVLKKKRKKEKEKKRGGLHKKKKKKRKKKKNRFPQASAWQNIKVALIHSYLSRSRKDLVVLRIGGGRLHSHA